MTTSGKILAEALQQFVAGQSALRGERLDLVGAERVGEIAGRDLLVGTVADPGIGLIAMALLLELIQEVAEAAAQDAAGRAAREQPAQSALQHVAETAARAAAGQAGIHIAGCGRGRWLRRGPGLVAAEMLDAPSRPAAPGSPSSSATSRRRYRIVRWGCSGRVGRSACR